MDSTSVVSQTAQTVNDVIDHIASKLSVPVAHLWGVLVRQAYAEFWMALLFVALLTLPAVAGVIAMKRLYPVVYAHQLESHKRRWPTLDPDADMFGYWMLVALLSIVGGTVLVCALAYLVHSVGYLINPEYFALQTVLHAVR